MMKVMGCARVESDCARSAFDSLARLRAVLGLGHGIVSWGADRRRTGGADDERRRETLFRF